MPPLPPAAPAPVELAATVELLVAPPPEADELADALVVAAVSPSSSPQAFSESANTPAATKASAMSLRMPH